MTEAVTPARVRVRLTRQAILDAVTELLERDGLDAISTRAVGDALAVHPTALYRHFRDMDELLREAADGILAGIAYGIADVATDGATDGAGITATAGATVGQDDRDPLRDLMILCHALRAALVSHPGAARVMANGPSRMPNEQALTDRMLGLLVTAGLGVDDAALAYHALIELVVGSAAINARAARDEPEDEETRHRRWRSDYLGAPPSEFPNLVRVGPHLYPSSQKQFEFGLRLMLDGLRAALS